MLKQVQHDAIPSDGSRPTCGHSAHVGASPIAVDPLPMHGYPREPAIISVEPIYGNDWVSAPDQKPRDIPARFHREVEPGETAMGKIITSSHEFEGASATLTPRSVEPTDIFNVEIAKDARVIAHGDARCS